MTTGPLPKPTKLTWYVSFERMRTKIRTAEPFQNEHDAKAFAKTKLAAGLNVSAGTLNPHLPKRTISSKQVLDWLDEPEGEMRNDQPDRKAEGTETNE